MFGIHAKDDRFLKLVAAFFQEFGHLVGDALGSFVDDQTAVKVLLVVNTVFDLVAVLVRLAFFRTVAFHVHIQMNLHHLVGREESVMDALLQRVGIDGLAEVVNVRDVLGLFRRRGEADLRGAGKVVEDLAPGGIFRRTAPVALVDHNQVEEVRGKFAEQLLPIFRARDGLIEPEVDLVGGVDAPMLLVDGEWQVNLGAVLALDRLRPGAELGHGRAKGTEVVHHRLVNQDVAVGEVKDAFLLAGFPQTPDDLERGIGLARAGRHDEENADLPFGDGLNRIVNGDALVVARLLAGGIVVVVLKDDSFFRGSEPFPGAVSRPELLRRREGVERQLGFRLSAQTGPVVKQEGIAVR